MDEGSTGFAFQRLPDLAAPLVFLVRERRENGEAGVTATEVEKEERTFLVSSN